MNAFALFMWVSLMLFCIGIGIGIGFDLARREQRKARTDWRLSQTKHKNVVAIREYQTLARSRRHWMA